MIDVKKLREHAESHGGYAIGLTGCTLTELLDRLEAAEQREQAMAAHVERQSELLRRLVAAMRAYEMDVEPDFPPPRDHRTMMSDAEAALDATPETSLARLIAVKQAEAMEGWFSQIRHMEGLNTYDCIESAELYANELRRQASGESS